MEDALRRVATGFRLVFYGLLITVAAALTFVVGAAGAQGGIEKVNAALVLTVGGLAALGALVGLVGRFRCLALPPETGAAKALVATSIVLDVVGLVTIGVHAADIGSDFLSVPAKRGTAAGVMVAPVLAAIPFMFFARSVAPFTRRPDLRSPALLVALLSIGTILCYGSGVAVILVGVAAGAPGRAVMAGTCAGFLLMCGGFIFAIVATVFYAMLLLATSAAVRALVEPPPRGTSGNRDADKDDRPRRWDDYDEDEERPRRRR